MQEQGGGCERLWHGPRWPHALTRQEKKAGSGVPAAGSRGTGGLGKGEGANPTVRSPEKGHAGSEGLGESSPAQVRSRHHGYAGVTADPHRALRPLGSPAWQTLALPQSLPAWLSPALRDWKLAPGLGSGQQRGVGQRRSCHGSATSSMQGGMVPLCPHQVVTPQAQPVVPEPWRGRGQREGQTEHHRTQQGRSPLSKSRGWDMRGRDAPRGPLSPSPVPAPIPPPQPLPSPMAPGPPSGGGLSPSPEPLGHPGGPPRAAGSSPVCW